MSDAKHTPTPWRAGYASESERKHEMIVRAEHVDGQPWVAVCRSNFGDIPIEANASFIALAANNHAALLAACKRAVKARRHATDCTYRPCDCYLRDCRAAVERAEGRTP